MPFIYAENGNQRTETRERKPESKEQRAMPRKEEIEASVNDIMVTDFPAIRSGHDAIAAIRENMGGADDVSSFSLCRIGVTPGGIAKLTIKDPFSGDEIADSINCAITHISRARSYWERSLDEDDSGGGAPDCFSSDMITGYGRRAGETEEGQHTCEECPMSKFGSGKNGSKACSERMELFVVRQDDESFLPSVVTVQPGSLRQIRSWMLGLGSRGMRVSDVLVNISVEQTKNKGGKSFGRLVFKHLRKLEAEEAGAVKAYGAMIAETFKS